MSGMFNVDMCETSTYTGLTSSSQIKVKPRLLFVAYTKT
jgi:hypothetical protein